MMIGNSKWNIAGTLGFVCAFLWLGMGALTGCAGSPDAESQEETPVQQVGETQAVQQDEAVEYGEAAEQLFEHYPAQAEMTAGPFEDTQWNRLEGPEVRDVLEEHPEMDLLDSEGLALPMTLGELLELPGAVAYHFLGHGKPLTDVEVVVVPFPESGAGVGGKFEDIDAPAFVIPLGQSFPQGEDGPPRADADLERWPELDEEKLGELLDAGESFVVYQHMTGCPGSPHLNEQLAGLELAEDFPLYVDHDYEAFDEHVDEDRLRLPASGFVAFDDGDWVDFYPGMLSPVEDTFAQFIARRGLGEGPERPVVDAESFGENADVALSLTWSNHWSSLDMDDENLRGMRINRGAISGSSFRNADLSGAVFRETLIAHSDFEDADFTDASIEDVTVRDVVCTDGVTRSGDGEKCLKR